MCRLLIAFIAVVTIQQAPPATEIFLAPLTPTGIGTAINITNSPGYDNQPHFQPDSRSILLTSNRDGKQTDIYRYDIAGKQLTQLTRTAESEYSPTPTPDGKTFSVIRVEADTTQRLWRFDLDGSNPRLVLENVKPVGYHVWIDGTRLALFILGAGTAPATLQVADTATGKSEIVETAIGRALHIRPRTGAVSFVHKPANQPWVIKTLNPKTREIATVTPTLEGVEDLAWRPDGSLIMAKGAVLYRWREGDAAWTKFADLPAGLVKSVTRLAISPDGQWIAFVGST